MDAKSRKIGIILFGILSVVAEMEEKRQNSSCYEIYVPKKGENHKEVCNEYEEKIICRGKEILSEFDRSKDSGEIINPLVFVVNNVTELAEIATEAKRKLAGFESLPEDCVFTYAFRGVNC